MNLRENDWVLKNIRTQLKSSQYDNASLARAIGISSGELSKILSGERLNYYKHLPAIAEYLNIPFLKLVAKNDNGVSQNEEVAANAINSNKSYELYERLIKEMNERIARLELHIQEKEETVAYFRDNYQRLKVRVENGDIVK